MLKQLLKAAVTMGLTAESWLILKKFRPRIVAITGSVGKTSTKDAIYFMFAGQGILTRRSPKSYNSELGIPLTIIGGETAWLKPLGWLANLAKGLRLLLPGAGPYPRWLVVEVGVERPGDIKKITRWLPVDIAVLTRLPQTPVHLEFFSSEEDLWQEKTELARAAGREGLAVLNYDDEALRRFADKAAGRVWTYGFAPGARVRAGNERLTYQTVGGRKLPAGWSLKVDYDGNNVPLRLPGILGRHQLYAALAAVTVGLTQGFNLVAIAEALNKWETPPGRMKLIAGIKNSLIIDDSYNSSPVALSAALDTLAAIETAGRRIAVLGDMLELGARTPEAHRAVGVRAAEVCDILVTVGLRAKFIDEGAAKKKMSAKKRFHFDEARPAGQALQEMLKEGDLILVKGSQALRLERTVEEIMAEPERKTKLLVRQEPEWQNK